MRFFVDFAAMFGGVSLIYLVLRIAKRFLAGPDWLINLVYGLDDMLFQWARNILAPEEPPLVPGLNRYKEDALDSEQQWFGLEEIVVPTEEDKQQFLKAVEYIHDLTEIDSDYIAVNYIMHLYEVPDKIKVRPRPTVL